MRLHVRSCVKWREPSFCHCTDGCTLTSRSSSRYSIMTSPWPTLQDVSYSGNCRFVRDISAHPTSQFAAPPSTLTRHTLSPRRNLPLHVLTRVYTSLLSFGNRNTDYIQQLTADSRLGIMHAREMSGLRTTVSLPYGLATRPVCTVPPAYCAIYRPGGVSKHYIRGVPILCRIWGAGKAKGEGEGEGHGGARGCMGGDFV